MSLPRARPIEHMLPYSPVTAKAAVAKPSNKAPAKADVMKLLTMIIPPRGLGALRVARLFYSTSGGANFCDLSHLGVMGALVHRLGLQQGKSGGSAPLARAGKDPKC